MAKVAQLIKDSSLHESRTSNDTIRLWENFRDQALLWRALALLQIPSTLALVILCFMLWSSRSIILNVPSKPLPGTYQAQQIPDSEFINVATNFVNLIATYQPSVAERQFRRASEMTIEPLYSKFKLEMLSGEVKTIESTNRTQVYFVDPSTVKLMRQDNQVIISMNGERQKIIAGRELPIKTTAFTVTMGTIPRHDLNPYGIVVENVAFEDLTETE